MRRGKGAKDYLKEPYVRILTPDEETRTFTAEILEFPGCVAQGNTPQEAYRRLEKTAKGWIEAALDLGQEIPPPLSTHEYGGKFLLRLPKSIHRQAALAAERDGTSLNQFIVTAISEKVGATNLYDRLVAKVEQQVGKEINKCLGPLLHTIECQLFAAATKARTVSLQLKRQPEPYKTGSDNNAFVAMGAN